MIENWKPVVGFEGLYEVSDQGRVLSMARIVPHKTSGQLTLPARIMVGSRRATLKYPMVNLWKDGKQYACYVHALVLEAFVGPRPPKHEACHFDGSKDNNHLSNLRWGTRSENMLDAVRHGTWTNKASIAARWGDRA